jgi:predicted nucleotidyltransferase
MAIIDEMIEAKARKAMEGLNRNIRVAAAYLFGSPVAGKTDQWSDIDLAIFAAWILSHGIEVRP